MTNIYETKHFPFQRRDHQRWEIPHGGTISYGPDSVTIHRWRKPQNHHQPVQAIHFELRLPALCWR